MVALSKLDAAVLHLQQLGAAREGDGEGLAVSDVDESDADARGWKTCRMNQMLMQDW